MRMLRPACIRGSRRERMLPSGCHGVHWCRRHPGCRAGRYSLSKRAHGAAVPVPSRPCGNGFSCSPRSRGLGRVSHVFALYGCAHVQYHAVVLPRTPDINIAPAPRPPPKPDPPRRPLARAASPRLLTHLPRASSQSCTPGPATRHQARCRLGGPHTPAPPPAPRPLASLRSCRGWREGRGTVRVRC